MADTLYPDSLSVLQANMRKAVRDGEPPPLVGACSPPKNWTLPTSRLMP